MQRKTAWLNQTKNATPRGVPLNTDAVSVLREQIGKHSRYCFTYQGEPIRWELSNSAWHTALKKAGIENLRFSRSASYLGVLASSGWNELRRAEGAWGMEVAQYGGSLCEVSNRASSGCGVSDRERPGWECGAVFHVFPTPGIEKGLASRPSLLDSGGSGEIRTRDQRIKSPLLYQLSYRPVDGVET
jgi:hypothetical protein